MTTPMRAILIGVLAIGGCDSSSPPPPVSSRCAELVERGELPLFDSHLHWTSPASDAYSADDMVGMLEASGVCRAILSSSPNERTTELLGLAPNLIVPALRLYRTADDKFQWSERTDMRDYITQGLPATTYAAIGEFHLFQEARMDSPGVQAVTEAAASTGLFLLAHVEPSHIDYFFGAVPAVRILWDHGGFQLPDVLESYLVRYPALWVDLAGRDDDVAPGGVLDPAWVDLFERHPDRFLVGSDPWTEELTRNLVERLEKTRAWVQQLPPDLSANVAYQNGQDLFPLLD